MSLNKVAVALIGFSILLWLVFASSLAIGAIAVVSFLIKTFFGG